MRLESALEIVGALKDRFGEPMTVTDICRVAPLSYQPVYTCVRWLADRKAVSVRKQGQRLYCEPAATPAGSLWLAHRSVQEVSRSDSRVVRELTASLEGRMRGGTAAGAIAALDPAQDEHGVLYVSDGFLGQAIKSVPVRVVSRTQLAGLLVGRDGSCEVARRILPLCGQQLLWALGLAARNSTRATGVGALRPRPARRRAFID